MRKGGYTKERDGQVIIGEWDYTKLEVTVGARRPGNSEIAIKPGEYGRVKMVCHRLEMVR